MVFVCERLRQGWKTTHTARVGRGPSYPQLFRQNFPFLRVAEGGGTAGVRLRGNHILLCLFGDEMNISGIYILSVLLRIPRAGLANERSIIEIF